jgi:hypothetical protein
MSFHRSRARRAGAVLSLALALAGIGLLAGSPAGPPSGAAGDRYRAGEPALERRALPVEAAERARALAIPLLAALELPAGPGVGAEQIVDRFAGDTVDELTVSDEVGRRLAILRIRGDGRLASAVRLGWRPAGGPRIDAGRAAARTEALARAAGLTTSGRPTIARDADGGWRATWTRTVDGVPVLGDGATVTIFGDGTFHAAAQRESELAPVPATILDRATAERLVAERLVALLGADDAGRTRLEDLRLAWVAPNDTFNPDAPDAPDPVLRLAWVALVRTSEPLADHLRALQLYLDAGDGALIGGDLLR